VQDRAGAADGEASNDGTNPTGISQCTPIVQVNATSARIGTTAATPADGALMVSGNLAVGGSNTSPANSTGAPEVILEGTAPLIAFRDESGGTDDYVVMNDDGAFKIKNDTDNSTPLTISNSGDVGIGVATPTFASGGGVHIDAGATTRLHLTSTATGSASGDGAELTIGTDSDFYVMNREAAKIRFYTNGTERLTIGSAGLATFSNGIDVHGSAEFGKVQHGDDQDVTLADDASLAISSTGCGAMLLHIYDANFGYGGLVFVSYAGDPIIVADPSSAFSISDTDGKLCVLHASTSSMGVSFKNRIGASHGFRILVTAADIS